MRNPLRFLTRIKTRLFLTRSQWRALAWPIFWSVVAALLMRLPFPKIEWGWVAWFGLAPFLAQLYGRTVKEGAWLALIFGQVYFYLNLTWLNTLFIFNIFVPLGILLAALVCAVYLSVFGALAVIILRRLGPIARFLFVPALWVAIEVWRSWGEIGFPWMYLGHTQVDYLRMIQVADLTGVYGISFVIAIVNMALAETWHSFAIKSFSRGKLVLEWAVALILVVFIAGYGSWRLAQSERLTAPESGKKQFRVAIIQQGIDQVRKNKSYMAELPDGEPDDNLREKIQTEMNQELEAVLHRMKEDLKKRGEPSPDLIVMPESAITNFFFNLWRKPNLVEMVRGWARDMGASIFLGANRIVPPVGEWSEENPGEMYNSAYLIKPDGTAPDPSYDKIHLVPFGESASYLAYLPYGRSILGIGDFNIGKNHTKFSVGDRTFGCVICFESCFPYLFRPYDRDNVDFMTIITNDAWYRMSSGARRHQTQAIFRAIEMRRPVVRSASTGISCIIDPWGRTKTAIGLREGETDYRVADLPVRPAEMRDMHTLYMRSWGEWFGALCFVYCIAALLVARRAIRKEFVASALPAAKVNISSKSRSSR